MDVETIIQGGGLVLSGGVVVKLLDWARAAWTARNQRTEITPDPINVRKEDKFVTRGEFNRHVEDNARDHENMFARLNANDKLTSKLEGILEGIREDLAAIKNKLFRSK